MSTYSDDYNEAYDDADLFDAEGLDDAEGTDDAEESSAARARRRRRQLALARRRTAARQSLPSPAPSGPRAVVNAVKELDLQTQVQQDSLRSYSAAQRRKEVRTNLVPALSLLVAEGFRAFGTPDNSVVRVGLEAAPLALLPWGPAYRGIRVVQHPLVIGGAGGLTLAFVGQRRVSDSAVHTINVLGPSTLTVGGQDVFLADVLDGKGRPSKVAATWSSDNPAVADIVATTGRVTAGTATGVAIISATAGDVVRRVRVEVVDNSFGPTAGARASSGPTGSTGSK
jgi:uncharacterized protein YjdB